MTELERIENEMVEVEERIAWAERDRRHDDVQRLKAQRHALVLRRQKVERRQVRAVRHGR